MHNVEPLRKANRLTKKLREDNSYGKASFSTWIKTRKYFHRDHPPANFRAQGHLDFDFDFEHLRKTNSSATFDTRARRL